MATTMTPEQLRKLSEQTPTFAAGPDVAPPSAYLSLVPATSSSYPQAPKARQPEPTPIPTPTLSQPVVEGGAKIDEIKRRSSSVSSDVAKTPSPFRFLKLGPVHWGEHPGDHKSDWHDTRIE